eukprot:CAMPEP_0174343980 /NCGR_PEP_ID=MMETSP0810-20121108/27384_1 /TAXON_ID=73025 ORGANISM="Eutreptiella gymnastica-like, Strain CCMP1594" /NCGR_SAMPLE_ID=MMETSP0810 /ASSEMBLY_ACC=CAM_ASM_000659 /LENGTH=135 /DNA_ID=CAMNT_0015467019 /DNA_START=880 /DNA_END=1285 /DNA_ORIENTATION=+
MALALSEVGESPTVSRRIRLITSLTMSVISAEENDPGIPTVDGSVLCKPKILMDWRDRMKELSATCVSRAVGNSAVRAAGSVHRTCLFVSEQPTVLDAGPGYVPDYSGDTDAGALGAHTCTVEYGDNVATIGAVW